MKKDYIFSLLCSICVIIAFFLGYAFAVRETHIKIQKIENKKHYVDIETSTKSIKITTLPENVFIRVNGNLMQSGSIDLEK